MKCDSNCAEKVCVCACGELESSWKMRNDFRLIGKKWPSPFGWTAVMLFALSKGGSFGWPVNCRFERAIQRARPGVLSTRKCSNNKWNGWFQRNVSKFCDAKIFIRHTQNVKMPVHTKPGTSENLRCLDVISAKVCVCVCVRQSKKLARQCEQLTGRITENLWQE